jgi:type III secretion protein J
VDRTRAMRPFRLAVLGLIALLLAGCDEDLYSHLGERDANEMMAVLLDHGINANRKLESDRSITISVPKAEFAQSVDLLKERGYPRDKYATVADVFPGDKLISSPLQERARLNYALSQELAHTISEIDGVLSARVHIVLPEEAELQKAAVPSSASVFIRHLRSAELQSSVPQIKTLVANSVAGVTYDRVTVVLVPVAGAPAAQPAAGTGGAKVSSMLQGRNAPDAYWAIGALGVLAVVGSGAVVRRRYTAQRTTVKLDAA